MSESTEGENIGIKKITTLIIEWELQQKNIHPYLPPPPFHSKLQCTPLKGLTLITSISRNADSFADRFFQIAAD